LASEATSIYSKKLNEERFLNGIGGILTLFLAGILIICVFSTTS
jgi:hypothetical protein